MKFILVILSYIASGYFTIYKISFEAIKQACIMFDIARESFTAMFLLGTILKVIFGYILWIIIAQVITLVLVFIFTD